MAHALQHASLIGARAAAASTSWPGAVHSVPRFLFPRYTLQRGSQPGKSTLHLAYSHLRSQKRYASSNPPTVRSTAVKTKAASSSYSPVSSTSSLSESTQGDDKLNPPPSTLPPPLDTPTRQGGQSAPAYWFALGKAYLSFYKTGIKAVWNNAQEGRALRNAWLENGRISADVGLDRSILTRSQWQLIRRASADSWRLPAFGLVLLICGEFTVLLLPLVGGIVPHTCWIPTQVRHHRKIALKRQQAAYEKAPSVQQLQGHQENDSLKLVQGGIKLEDLSHEQLVYIGRYLNLYSKWWDRLWDYPPTWLLKKRIARWEAYIGRDDAAIERYGGAARLIPEELKWAADERGMICLEQSDKAVLENVQSWLRETRRQSVYSLLLTPINMWQINGQHTKGQ